MDRYSPTPRTRVHRRAQRATYDRTEIHAILDEALLAHVGFVADGQPYVLPMAFARADEMVLLHGSTRTRLLSLIADGLPICITVTLLDGLVLARSVFHHSMNYRSVTILGRGHEITAPAEKLSALEVITEHVAPGRWKVARRPSPGELRATRVVAVPIEEIVAKRRSGSSLDDEADVRLPVWAGVVPLALAAGAPIADAQLPAGTAVPTAVERLARRHTPPASSASAATAGRSGVKRAAPSRPRQPGRRRSR